ncbi:proteasome regulatory particle base subunit [Coelomomyces lativittatus]|nr:proteasome regulatory particle base subunit [Coelomomyces lativittatus]KAJ1516402.1 proteasome regulatory particle base subunit [Coelomomyces lativittatus]KAJ1516680.1 proteasome regulatory particle base subunit [Coelomomyces lativittatus]
MSTMILTSAAGIVSLLDEKDESLKYYALQRLNEIIDSFWAEISESLNKIEILFEDKSFKHHQLAGLVAAKTYFHLGALSESTIFALGAGDLLDLNTKSEFVDTIIARCIDRYISERIQSCENENAMVVSDPGLEKVVEWVFSRCFAEKEFQQAIGIAIESRRIDIIQKAINAGDKCELLKYILGCSLTFIQNQGFRSQVLRLLVQTYSELDEPDYFSMCICFVNLDDPKGCAEILNTLIQKSEKHYLIALQLAFDLEEIVTQKFLKQVSEGLQTSAHEEKLKNILSGQITIQLHLEFLHRNNQTDLQLLKASKNALDSRNSLQHVAITFANALMNAGTTSDQFLRENLDWLSRANNWSKFSATAALGVIHKGHVSKSMALLEPYLPQNGVASSVYSEGGALLALGLLNANHSQPLDYLRTALKDTSNEAIQHGACLGIGVSGIATGNMDVYEELKSILHTDNAVASDAAAMAMGLVMLGTGHEAILDELLQYAHETQHERIIRGLSIGMALLMYGQENQADKFIALLLADKDALIRYGGAFMIAMAYAGTSNNKALRQLLHISVSDVNDEVRRAAVMAIGFLYSNQPSQVPRIVELLSESFNPHVRYGTCLAVGISCASTNHPEALSLLETLLEDSVDFVRQGALVAQGLVQIQHANQPPGQNSFRSLLTKVITDKHEGQLTKFGAVLAQGILDAGGRNCSISMRSRQGTNNVLSMVGMVLFLQYWYWYPLTLFLSLSMQPTMLIALDQDLRIPKFEFTSQAKPSLFAYPPLYQAPTQQKVEKMYAVLSTSAKAKARAKKKNSLVGGESLMDVDSPLIVPSMNSPQTSTSVDALSPIVSPASDTVTNPTPSEKPLTKKKEASFENKPNLSRVLPAQEKYISFANCPYKPVKSTRFSGILIMENVANNPDQEYLELRVNTPMPSTASTTTTVPAETDPPQNPVTTNEVRPPSPFEYPFDD